MEDALWVQEYSSLTDRLCWFVDLNNQQFLGAKVRNYSSPPIQSDHEIKCNAAASPGLSNRSEVSSFQQLGMKRHIHGQRHKKRPWEPILNALVSW